eukprot:CAMPEP_0204284372 /NCGR_PEP_ID=MMETSP0468-20130131/48362_1 /ASSEMBLY_ACC=CAM_ASM_000383 /TAXON_ID=2969 /ORGANISM="Oxyrrhis marina" /LENGTH=116 /DNA_ID=CAMNT_0051262095 /DNA_START=200 /DNA_END=550 /DNA_ORIENTATION=+
MVVQRNATACATNSKSKAAPLAAQDSGPLIRLQNLIPEILPAQVPRLRRIFTDPQCTLQRHRWHHVRLQVLLKRRPLPAVAVGNCIAQDNLTIGESLQHTTLRAQSLIPLQMTVVG